MFSYSWYQMNISRQRDDVSAYTTGESACNSHWLEDWHDEQIKYWNKIFLSILLSCKN
jgi:hypothetical protein